MSIVRDIKGGEVRIYTDYGRIMRPLFIVGEDQKLTIKKSHIYKIRNNTEGDYGWHDVLFEVSNRLMTPRNAKESFLFVSPYPYFTVFGTRFLVHIV